MRLLIVMRHAQAAKASLAGGDFERPLTDSGRADARLIGQALKGAGLVPDLALVSAARRTQETWGELSQLFPAARLDVRKSLYNADDFILREAVESATEADTVLLIAHNPGIHGYAVRLLLEGCAASKIVDKVDNRFPTATAVAFAIDQAERPNYDGLFLAADLGGSGRD